MQNRWNGKYLAVILGVLILIGLGVWGLGSNQSEPAMTQTEEEAPNQEKRATAQLEVSSMVQQKCLTCHATDGGKVERISDVRKTPEGWSVTLSRMQNVWGLEITEDEKKQLIRDLSESNGLAPSEMEPVMYWLTKRGSEMEEIPDPSLSQTCIRCHAIGQPFAQRRTAEEWDKLKDFHVAFNPSLIYQVRDVDWDEVAGAATEYLKKNYAFDNPEYRQWKESKTKLSPEGTWKIIGISAEDGMYTGTSTITKLSDDQYKEQRTITMNGKEIRHEANTTLYSGFTLRGSLDGEEKFRGYYNIDAKDKKITGTRVKVGDNGIYFDENYYGAEGKKVLDLWPRSIQKGQLTTVRIAAVGLPEKVTKEQLLTDPHLEVVQVVKQQGDDLWVEVKAKEVSDQAKISIKGLEQELSVRVYQQVDFIKIAPDYGLGRLEYDQQLQSVQFQSQAFAYGADGKPDTADDVMLGPVNSTWSMTEHKQYGMDDHDVHFIGKLNESSGLFTPAQGGTNEKREWKTNNAGGVKVHAQYHEPGTGRILKDDAFLLNTVPDFVLPIQ